MITPGTLQGLKQIQLSTLSPVMWSLKGGYPRKPMTVPIGRETGLGGLGVAGDDGRYASVPLEYQRQPVWNDLYRVGVIGGMSRVAPFGPAAFGTEEAGGGTDAWKKWIFILGAIGLASLLLTRFA
jgi:hypothetical protein